GYLKAADAKTGKVVWQFQTGCGVVATPVTWQQGGEQYVSVVSGWGGAVPLWGGGVAKKVNFLERGGMVWVFKIPKAVGKWRGGRDDSPHTPQLRSSQL